MYYLCASFLYARLSVFCMSTLSSVSFIFGPLISETPCLVNEKLLAKYQQYDMANRDIQVLNLRAL